MRLLHVIPSINPACGGPVEAVRTFMAHPGATGQAVLTLDHGTDPWLKTFPSPVYTAGPGRGKYGYTRRLDRWLDANICNYDALIIHGCWQYHAPAASRAARRAGLPYYIFPHGMLDPWFQRQSQLKHFKKLLYWPVERRVLENAASVLFTCQMEQDLSQVSFRFRCLPRIVPLGVEPPAANPEEARSAFFAKFPELRGKRIILFLGRLHPKKGADMLVRAFAGLVQPDARLVISGPAANPKYDAALRELARAGAADRVHFTGMLTGIVKTGALLAADAFILPSHQENFGISVAEALACGVPVLISNQVNIWREIQADNAGLIAPDTDAGVRQLLAEWFALVPEAANQMRSAARTCWERRFRAEVASARLIDTVSERTEASNDRRPLQFSSIHA